MTNAAVQKGKELENYIVQWLRDTGLDNRAIRTPGSGNGKIKGDIWNDLGLSIECKNTAGFQKSWFQQNEKSAMGYSKEVLIWHMPRTSLHDSKVIIDLDFFGELLKKHKEPEIKQPDRQLSWKLRNLIRLAKDIINELE